MHVALVHLHALAGVTVDQHAAILRDKKVARTHIAMPDIGFFGLSNADGFEEGRFKH